MNNNGAIMIISGYFYLFLITFAIIAIYLSIKFAIRKKRKKKAYYLLTENYKVVTADKDGIPLFMEKGGNYEQI